MVPKGILLQRLCPGQQFTKLSGCALLYNEARKVLMKMSGSSSAVERQLPKLDVAGSIPVSRSKFRIF